jgi:hypothetical protein
MQVLKIGIYEVITALGLLGVIDLYLSLHNDQRLINPTIVIAGLITLYSVIAVASEAVIVAELRPTLRQVLAFNILVAATITQPGWNRLNMFEILTGVAVVTTILRMLISTISLRASKVRVRRVTSALVGAPLLVGAVWTGVSLVEEVYYSYYLFPKFKESYITPTRWQDIVSLVALWGGTILLLYVSYRLLKYAFRYKPAVAA